MTDICGYPPDLAVHLTLYNGLFRTDGVRLLDKANRTVDTLLYSLPNTNNLPGDASDPVNEIVYPAAPLQSGSSLSRKFPGQDSDDKSDWMILSLNDRTPQSSCCEE